MRRRSPSMWRSVLLVGAVALVGAVVGVAGLPQFASAAVGDTVCCYRWWGVGTQTVGANVTKTSPTTSEIDWARVYLDGGDSPSYGVVVKTKSWGLSNGGTSVGGHSTWVVQNPTGTIPNAYAQCYWTDWMNAGYSLSMACEMKYRI